MIVSFYDRNFKGLQDNASLVVDINSYSLIRRGVDFDELKCVCEPFTEDIQPTFVVVKNDRGNYVYGALAGIPELTSDRKTVINGSDLKSMFKSDIILNMTTAPPYIDTFFRHIFNLWNEQVNQGSFECELIFSQSAAALPYGSLKHQNITGVFNVWDDIFAPYLKYYGLYMTTSLDIVEKKVVFKIGKAMQNNLNIKLWEHGQYDYGKWVADINETQGYVVYNGNYTEGYKWILTSQNAITTNASLRDIYPIKRKIILKEASSSAQVNSLLNEANIEALELLCESMYNEDIVLSNIQADFETKFNIYVKRGQGLYKSLPCGELHYDASGLKKVKVGYRFTGLQFLL